MSAENQEQTGVHPSSVGSGEQPDTGSSDNSSIQKQGGETQGGDQSYPEQRHAGKVGYGPAYHQGPTAGDKITGMKEVLKGKVTKNPDLVQHGTDLKTGEAAKKQEENEVDPFATAEDSKSQSKENSNEGTGPTGQGAAHQGGAEAAASVAPEGTEAAESQRQGGNVDGVKNIG